MVVTFTEEEVLDALNSLVTHGDEKNPEISKYWKIRYSLFSKFSDGIILDKESWYSVTPELLSVYISRVVSCDTIVDAFCGAGGNTHQFANTCKKVISIDIDRKKIVYAINNVSVYGAKNNVQFIVGNFMKEKILIEKADIIHASPPWGGPDYINNEKYHPSSMLGVDFAKLVSLCYSMANSVVLFLPRTTDVDEASKFAPGKGYCYVERVHLRGRFLGVYVFYGEIAEKFIKKRDSMARDAIL